MGVKRSLVAALLAGVSLGAACRGTAPDRDLPPEREFSAILIGLRVTTPGGETRQASLTVNFESKGGARADVYRLPLSAKEPMLFTIEPADYYFAPVRGVFGGSGTTLEFELGGHPYSLPFPPTWKKSKPFELKPGKANVLGIIEVRLTEKPDAKKPLVAQIRLDSSTAAKRQIVQTTLQALNDVSRPNDFSEGEVSWTAELQAALVGLSAAPASSLP